jgi:sugar phosphate isomerase/epimerase
VDNKILAQVLRQKMNFEQAVEAKTFTIIGKGSIDFPAFFRVLAKNDYSGWMVVEQDVKFGATVVPPAQSIAASLKYLQSVTNQLVPTSVGP